MRRTLLPKLLALACVFILLAGYALAAPNFCPNCGKAVGANTDYKFCPHCGYDFSKAENTGGNVFDTTQSAQSNTNSLAVPWTGNGVSISLISPSGSRLIPYRGHKTSYDRFLARSRGDWLYQREEMHDLKGLFTVGNMIYADFNYSDGDRRRMFFPKAEFNLGDGIPEYQMVVKARGTLHRNVTPYNYPATDSNHRGHFRSWNLRKGMEVQIYFEENGWYYCEYWGKSDYAEGWVQLWVPKDAVTVK